MSKLIDRKGFKFFKLTVIEFVRLNKYKTAIWKCQCECGNFCEVSSLAIKTGHKQSCGCGKKETQYRLKKGEAGFNRFYTDLRRRSTNKNLKFNMSKEEVKTISQQNCYYCGVAPKQIYKHSEVTKGLTTEGIENSKFIYNGLDRIDNLKGYEPDNVLPCCGICNKLRGTYLSVKETKQVIQLIQQLRNKTNIWE